MPTDAETPQPQEKETALYVVPFRAIGSVLIRATSADEAVELANDNFGPIELEQGGCFESLEYDDRNGPGVDIDPTETESAPSPISLYAVQTTWDGLPQAPRLFMDRDEAERTYAALGVHADLPFDEEQGAFDNSEAHHVEVRMWVVRAAFGDSETEVPLAEEAEKVDRVLAALAAKRDEAQKAREAVAELNTPGGGCD